MGEYADAIIEGDSCQLCGVPIEDGPGYPTYCSVECAKDDEAPRDEIEAVRQRLREVGS